MTQYRVLASEGRQRYIYTKNPKNIKEKKAIQVHGAEHFTDPRHRTVTVTGAWQDTEPMYCIVLVNIKYVL
jgi:hypothetical protein